MAGVRLLVWLVLRSAALGGIMASMSTTTQPPKPKRRWYQFSLKTLLIVMTVATVAFGGWVQYMRKRAQENRERVVAVAEAVAAIEEMGGWVTSEHEDLRSQTWLEKQFGDPGGVDDPVGVLTITRVDFVGRYRVTDADLEHLKVMTNLEELLLGEGRVTDAGLEHLKGLTNLKVLHLYRTNIGDGGFERLKSLTNLEQLNAHSTQVTDAGLGHLEGLTTCVGPVGLFLV